MTFKVTWDNQEVKAWQREISQRWARTEAPKLLTTARAEAPKGGPFSGSFGQAPHPGQLRASHKVDIRRIGKYDAIEISANTRYAIVVHEGRGPVKPKVAGGKLVWRNQFTGAIVRAKVSPRSGRNVAPDRWLIRAMRRRGYDIV